MRDDRLGAVGIKADKVVWAFWQRLKHAEALSIHSYIGLQSTSFHILCVFKFWPSYMFWSPSSFYPRHGLVQSQQIKFGQIWIFFLVKITWFLLFCMWDILKRSYGEIFRQKSVWKTTICSLLMLSKDHSFCHLSNQLSGSITLSWPTIRSLKRVVCRMVGKGHFAAHKSAG